VNFPKEHVVLTVDPQENYNGMAFRFPQELWVFSFLLLILNVLKDICPCKVSRS
jgi:hypothetical protein